MDDPEGAPVAATKRSCRVRLPRQSVTVVLGLLADAAVGRDRSTLQGAMHRFWENRRVKRRLKLTPCRRPKLAPCGWRTGVAGRRCAKFPYRRSVAPLRNRLRAIRSGF